MLAKVSACRAVASSLAGFTARCPLPSGVPLPESGAVGRTAPGGSGTPAGLPHGESTDSAERSTVTQSLKKRPKPSENKGPEMLLYIQAANSDNCILRAGLLSIKCLGCGDRTAVELHPNDQVSRQRMASSATCLETRPEAGLSRYTHDHSSKDDSSPEMKTHGTPGATPSAGRAVRALAQPVEDTH